MHRLNYILCFLAIALCSSPSSADTLCQRNCTFVLKSEDNGEYTIVNAERAQQRMTPWSTFKIPNSLIALDLGIIENTEVVLTFDRERYPVENWWPEIWYKKPISLQTAFKYSALPIYQTTAKKIGQDQMNQYLKAFAYGNQDISSGIDNFWLNKSIKISAKEQVDFLQRMYQRELPVSDNALAQLKRIMLVTSTSDYKLYAKTGAGGIGNGQYLGWYVGFVENKDGVYYFALNIDGPSFKEVGKMRIDAVMQQLQLAKVI
ncbi:penicillin-binding transpeptidase domain-containing protein [Thalassotalea maritima]|uniref:penicillin-binding transpeptidase domain-containing protein n=1 Tax=Thalassotalea maritima TaxID=3242416 RepID=UPI003526C53F